VLSPGEAFLSVISGVLGIYCEFIWPGRVFAGIAGAAFTCAGIFALARRPLTPAGVMLLTLAAGLFLIEAFWRVDMIAGLAGTVCLTAGAILLVRAPAAIPPAFALPTCIIFGGVTILLSRGAKRARRNKWSDLAT
jgi:membrane-bound ClpP family serine protease